MYDHPNDFPPPPVPAGPAPAPQWGWSANPAAPPAQPTAPYGYPTVPMAPPPGQWPGPRPRPRRQVGVAVVVMVAVLAALLGFGGGLASGFALGSGNATPAAAATVAPSASVTLRTPAAIASGDGQALLAKILPQPAGAKNLTVSGSAGGVMSLDQYVQKEYPDDPTEKGRMQSRNFLVAAQREWLDTTGVEVHIQLIQFAAADGAESSVLGQANAYNNDSEVTGNFTLPEPHGSGYEKSKLDPAGNRRMTVMAQDGPIAVFIFFFTPKALDRAAATTTLRQQFAALA